MSALILIAGCAEIPSNNSSQALCIADKLTMELAVLHSGRVPHRYISPDDEYSGVILGGYL